MDWNQWEYGVYLVNCLAIIQDKDSGKILIGRREQDQHIPTLTWAFPGGRPHYSESVEEGLKRQVKSKTGLEIEVTDLIFARTYPEQPAFLSLYFACSVMGGEAQPGELFTDLAWVDPDEIDSYFTTSVAPAIRQYLQQLHDQ